MTDMSFGRWLYYNMQHKQIIRNKINAEAMPLPDVIIGYLEACIEDPCKTKADAAMLKRKGVIR